MVTGPGQGRGRERQEQMHDKCNGGLLAATWLWEVRREESRMTPRDLAWVTGLTEKGGTAWSQLGAT